VLRIASKVGFALLSLLALFRHKRFELDRYCP